VLLAVEEVNRTGGIRGREIMLTAKDDRHDPEEARRVDRELIEEGVAAIIGHMTSAMTAAVLPLINEKRMLMIAPTVSSDEFSGIDDYFLRVMAPSLQESVRLAQAAFSMRGSRHVFVVYDEANASYSRRYLEAFVGEFQRLGGKVAGAEAFFSAREWRPAETAQNVVAAGADGVLLVAGAGDAAMLCQQLRKIGSDIPVFAAGWAMTDEFLRTGGPAVGSTVFSHVFDRESRTPGYLKFKKEFSDRFGREPDFAAMYAYEAAGVLFEAIATVGPSGPLKETIIRKGTFQGLQGDFALDRFGDAVRSRVIVIVRDGRFVTAE
jgi:branched-chain amino acid transport system substrate-binding protein